MVVLGASGIKKSKTSSTAQNNHNNIGKIAFFHGKPLFFLIFTLGEVDDTGGVLDSGDSGAFEALGGVDDVSNGGVCEVVPSEKSFAILIHTIFKKIKICRHYLKPFQK